MEKPKYTWNFDADAEYWRNGLFDSVEECVKEAEAENKFDGCVHDFVYVAECTFYKPHVDAGSVLEQLEEDAAGEFGEFAKCWDAVYFKEDTADGSLDELSEELTTAVIAWLKKKNRMPSFFVLENGAEKIKLKNYKEPPEGE